LRRSGDHKFSVGLKNRRIGRVIAAGEVDQLFAGAVETGVGAAVGVVGCNGEVCARSIGVGASHHEKCSAAAGNHCVGNISRCAGGGREAGQQRAGSVSECGVERPIRIETRRGELRANARHCRGSRLHDLPIRQNHDAARLIVGSAAETDAGDATIAEGGIQAPVGVVTGEAKLFRSRGADDSGDDRLPIGLHRQAAGRGEPHIVAGDPVHAEGRIESSDIFGLDHALGQHR
jgi:hypothetical protein